MRAKGDDIDPGAGTFGCFFGSNTRRKRLAVAGWVKSGRNQEQKAMGKSSKEGHSNVLPTAASKNVARGSNTAGRAKA